MADTQANGMATTAPQAAANAGAGNNTIDANFQAARAAGTAQIGAPDGSSYAVAPSASTTTISNGNKIDQVPGIINKTNDLATKGITSDANGNQTYANGNAVPAPDSNSDLPPAPTSDLSKPGISQGGYVGDVYYAPGSPLPTGADGKTVATTPTSPTDDIIQKNLLDLKASSDAMTANLIDSIHQQYASLRQQQEQTNTQQQAQTQNALLRGGVTGGGSSAQYAPISSDGIVQAQISYGVGQIADLNAKENSAIIQAQLAGQDRDFKLMDSLNAEISKIRDDKVAAATKLNDTLIAQNQKLRDEQLQSSKDNAVSSLYQQGITDPSQIMAKLKAQGITMTADEVSKTLTAIKPTADELNRQQAAIKFASEKGITKPFWLSGNTAINSITGLPVSLAEYQKATGQQVGLSESETDFSHIQAMATPDVQALKDKYPDAGIADTDTIAQAKAKLNSSAVYRKETYIAPSASGLLGGGGVTTVKGGNIVAGVTVPAGAAGDIEDVLAGRNTLQNLRLSMGRTNDAAAYIKSIRDGIHQIDPKFDFIASDAGGKFISSTYYQKAAAAINSVLPNIDKVVDLSNQVSRVGIKGVDNQLQKAAVQIGDQKVSNFREAQKLISDEIGIALGAGTVSDMKLQLGFDVTDPSVTPEVFASNMGIVKDFIQQRLNGLNSQRYSSSVDTSSSGFSVQAPDGNTYSFDSQDALDKFKQSAGIK